MRKILNWLFGSFFRTIGRVIAFLLLGTLFFYIVSKSGIEVPKWLAINVNASTLTSYGNYTGNSNTFNTCGNSGTYSYAKSSPSVQGAYYWERGNIGATISGKAYAMSFLFKTGLTAQKTYDVVITMNNNDFTNTLNANSIHLFNGSTCENMYNNDISLLSFTNSATSGTNTNKIKFRIYANSIISWWGFELLGGNKNITSINNFGVKSISITEVDTSGNNQVIENNNNNTQNIIDNDKQNTQNIIDNVNNQLNTCSDKEIKIYYNDRIINDKYLNSSGEQVNDVGSGISDYISLKQNTEYNIHLTNASFNSGSFCLYNANKILINCEAYSQRVDVSFNSNNAYYLRTSMTQQASNPTTISYNSCTNKIDYLNNNINDINSSINDTDISQSTNEASSFFNNFNTDTHGLTSVITAPLNAIQSLTSKSCSPLVLPIPFLNNKNLTLPCMRSVYDEFFGDFMIVYDVITLGIISYWIMVRIFNLVKDFKNPDHDEIEVMDL